MLVKVLAAAIQGINATLVTIEVNALRGIKFYLVGLPDNAVKESQQRINSAFHHNGLRFPSKQIIVNMAPADIKKEGSAYDLPIAIGILAADEAVSTAKLDRFLIMGELGLDGKILPIKGALPITIKATNAAIAIITHRLNALFLIRSRSCIIAVGITHITSIVVDDGYEASRYPSMSVGL